MAIQRKKDITITIIACLTASSRLVDYLTVATVTLITNTNFYQKRRPLGRHELKYENITADIKEIRYAGVI